MTVIGLQAFLGFLGAKILKKNMYRNLPFSRTLSQATPFKITILYISSIILQLFPPTLVLWLLSGSYAAGFPTETYNEFLFSAANSVSRLSGPWYTQPYYEYIRWIAHCTKFLVV